MLDAARPPRTRRAVDPLVRRATAGLDARASTTGLADATVAAAVAELR